MGQEIKWNPHYDLGVEKIDKEHQRLFRIINKLLKIKEEQGDTKWACEQCITFFERHALEHFSDEEEYMRSISYPEYEQHRRLHKTFRQDTLPALKKEVLANDFNQEVLEHFIGVCAGWLISHTLTEDVAIAGKSEPRFGKILRGDEIESLKTILQQLAFDLFRIEPHVVSDVYGAEKFGNGVYLRLIFDTRDPEKKYEVLLAFEEKMLINTVGSALGIKTAKLSSLVMHAARYTARQYVQRVLEQFPELRNYKLKDEALLTYDQFRHLFEVQPVQASILLDSGVGYMSYTVIAPHLAVEEGVNMEHENAMELVDEYLRHHEEEVLEEAKKPSVLVVDDSPTVHSVMESMLGEAYNLSFASSGMAAIRSILINRPDLVLLDYEMPVCDGPQTLEMLRSETDLSDVRVVFLTGRTDSETANRIVSLQPTGYLHKNMAPEDLRRRLDDFLEQPADAGMLPPEVEALIEQPKPKILLVDDSMAVRKMLETMLSDKYRVKAVSSAAAAIRSISHGKPDLVLLDYDMPVVDGPQTLEMLQAETDLSDVRVVFLTGRADSESVNRIMSLNPTGYLLKDMSAKDIRANIEEFLKLPADACVLPPEVEALIEPPKRKILLVDDSAAIRKMMEAMLKDKYDVTAVSSGVAAIRSISHGKPDLVLLDYEMPVCDGPQTLEMLQAETDLSDVRVVFLTGRSDPESVRRVMSLNPAGYLLKNLSADAMREKIDAFIEQAV